MERVLLLASTAAFAAAQPALTNQDDYHSSHSSHSSVEEGTKA
jgi:hypothetical protein